MQLAVEPEPLRAQLDELKAPLPPLLQATIPVGANGCDGDTSDTVAVHENDDLRVFEQLTVVDVECLVTVRLDVPELPERVESPL